MKFETLQSSDDEQRDVVSSAVSGAGLIVYFTLAVELALAVCTTGATKKENGPSVQPKCPKIASFRGPFFLVRQPYRYHNASERIASHGENSRRH